MIYEDNDCVYRYRLITITIKSVEILLFVFVFWVNGYNKQKRREKKSMCVCVCVWSEGSCMIWYDIIINEDDDEEHSFNTRAASTHTHTHARPHTERTWVWPGHTPCLLYTQLDDPSPLPRGPQGSAQSNKNVILFSFIILYIFCLGLSFQFMYVCMYMLYMLYILDYSLLYDICCLDKCKKPIRNVNWRWREWKWRNEECSSTRNIISKSKHFTWFR